MGIFQCHVSFQGCIPGSSKYAKYPRFAFLGAGRSKPENLQSPKQKPGFWDFEDPPQMRVSVKNTGGCILSMESLVVFFWDPYVSWFMK